MAESVARCTLCGSLATYSESEEVWRHAEPVHIHFTQSFCDKYGYPIKVMLDG